MIRVWLARTPARLIGKVKMTHFFHKKCVQMVRIHGFWTLPDPGIIENDEMTHFFSQKVCPFWWKSRKMTKIPIVIHIRNWWFWENWIRSNKTEVKMSEILGFRWKWSIRHTFFSKSVSDQWKWAISHPEGGAMVGFGLNWGGLDILFTQQQSGIWTELNWPEPNWSEAKWSEPWWSETRWSELNWTATKTKWSELNWTGRKTEWAELNWTGTGMNWTGTGWTELNPQCSGMWPSGKRAVPLPSSSVTLEVAALSSKPQLRPSSLFPLHSCPQTFKGYKEIQNKGGRGFQRR